MHITFKEENLDAKWIELIKEAKIIGLIQEEVRLFLVENNKDT